MKLKNVLAGLQKRYALEEINIISPTRVVFSGTLESWVNTKIEMLALKKKVENTEVVNRMMHNDKKAFIFIDEV